MRKRNPKKRVSVFMSACVLASMMAVSIPEYVTAKEWKAPPLLPYQPIEVKKTGSGEVTQRMMRKEAQTASNLSEYSLVEESLVPYETMSIQGRLKDEYAYQSNAYEMESADMVDFSAKEEDINAVKSCLLTKGAGVAGYYILFWLSYEDATYDNFVMFFDAEKVGTYDNLYQYDGTGSYVWQCRDGISRARGANVFTADSPELLKAVGTTNWQAGTNYKLQIYKNVTGEDPTSGTLALTKTGTIPFAGYHRIEIGDGVLLEQGEKYAVVITSATYNGEDVEIAIDASSSWDWAVFGSNALPGQSYVDFGDGWEDVSVDDENVRIKAYTDERQVASDGTTEEKPEQGSTASTVPTTGKAEETSTATKGDTAATLQPVIGETFALGNVTYTVISQEEAKVTDGKSAKQLHVKIPATVTWKGNTLKVTSIGQSAFLGAKNLKKVTLGKNIKTIGTKAFFGCKSLKTIQVKSKVLTKVDAKAFSGIPKKVSWKLPKDKRAKYRKLLGL